MKKYVLRRFRDDNELQMLLGRGTTVEGDERPKWYKNMTKVSHISHRGNSSNEHKMTWDLCFRSWLKPGMTWECDFEMPHRFNKPTQTAKLLISERFSQTGRMDHYCFWMSNGSLAAWVPVRQTVPKSVLIFFIGSRLETTCIMHHHATTVSMNGGWMHFQHLNIIHVLFPFFICMLKFLKVATTWGIGYKNYKYFYLFLLYSAMATSVEAAALWHWTCGEGVNVQWLTKIPALTD